MTIRAQESELKEEKCLGRTIEIQVSKSRAFSTSEGTMCPELLRGYDGLYSDVPN